MSDVIHSPVNWRRWVDAVLERLVARLLHRLVLGGLLIRFPGGGVVRQQAPLPGPRGEIRLRRWRGLARMAAGGDVGFAEAYIAGDWSTPDLVALVEVAARNEAALGSSIKPGLLGRWLNRLRHRRRRNSMRGSRRNIVEHYDLGDDFYAAWLDPTMTYSSALYTAPGQSLLQAQETKQDRVLSLLGVAPEHNVLEIGCGWGGLAERLAREHQCRLTGITLSPSQLDFAKRRLRAVGAEAELALRDYRQLTGRYDRIVAIEMLEAVGAEYWPGFFAQLRERLAPTGVADIQVITIAEERYESYRRSADFIQRHIFPGGMLPSITILRDQIARAGLRLDRAELFGASYAQTLAEWRRRFQAAWPLIEGGRRDERFRRKWEYYLAYCEAGFRAGALDVGLYRISHADPAACV